MTADADESFLASLGESGWELVAVSDRRMYLKKVVWTPAATPDPMPPSFGPWPSEEEIEAHYDKQEGRWLAKTEDGDVVLGYFEGRYYESLRFVSDGYHSRSDCASWTFCPVDRDGNKVARTTK